jgi:hypothetical protein
MLEMSITLCKIIGFASRWTMFARGTIAYLPFPLNRNRKELEKARCGQASS